MINVGSAIAFSREAGIATLRMNRPSSLNLLNASMLNALEECLLAVASDPATRCVIIAGEGRAFSAGGDLREMEAMAGDRAYAYARRGQSVLDLLDKLAVPSIAQLQGAALGGGCELALAATFRVASSSLVIGVPELSLGLTPGFGGSLRLPRLVGTQIARRMILTSQRLDANAALQVGLIDELVHPANLDVATLCIARKIAHLPQSSLREVLRRLQQTWPPLTQDAFHLEAEGFAEAFNSPNRTEGLAAFFAKREPRFK
jgi:enoyl-CoA hydratase